MAAAVATKTAWKLQEITAHRSNVSCLVLGKSSGRLMATGGDDCRVNIWSVNKPNCIMSLTGHTTPVESVKINTNEELIAAGSQSGSIRIWDLEAAKILRTLTGHKANICSLDFHPFDSLVASGSMDTNIKLWDVRRKGCVFRYKGHTQAVRGLRFSPDGKWLASSSEDHTVKLWDLAAGKIVSEFKGHSGPVNIIEFHPKQYLLASGSSDRTIRFWDLEKFVVFSSIHGTARCVQFNSNGCCLYIGSKNSLRVHGWQTDCCHDVVQVKWGKVIDLCVLNNHLIGVSFTQNSVSSFVVDLSCVSNCGSDLHRFIPDNNVLSQSLQASSFFPPVYGQQSTQRVNYHSEREQHSPRTENEISKRSIFASYFQGRFFVILSSEVKNPLKFWGVQNCWVQFIRDRDINCRVLELQANDNKAVCLQCPSGTRNVIGVKLPVLSIFIKPLCHPVTLKIQILDSEGEYRWFEACSKYTTLNLSNYFSTIYMNLDDTWNLISYNLFDHIKCRYTSLYQETAQIQVCGSCRIHTICFTDKCYNKEVLQEELRLPRCTTKAKRFPRKY